MTSLWRRSKWPVCAAAAALGACSDPAANNDVADANAVQANAAAGNEVAAPDLPAAGNETATANTATPKRDAAEPAAPQESYSALGQEPGWALRIGGGRIDYSGNYGEKKINVARPDPRPGSNGRRYVTERLTVDITYVRCNDAMSGFGFEHQVTVIADGETYKGCGGARRSGWDL